MKPLRNRPVGGIVDASVVVMSCSHSVGMMLQMLGGGKLEPLLQTFEDGTE